MEESEFKDKTTEWRGYTLRALEDINKELAELKEEIRTTNTKLDSLSNSLNLLQVKVAGIGAVSGIIASIILWLITKV